MPLAVDYPFEAARDRRHDLKRGGGRSCGKKRHSPPYVNSFSQAPHILIPSTGRRSEIDNQQGHSEDSSTDSFRE